MEDFIAGIVVVIGLVILIFFLKGIEDDSEQKEISKLNTEIHSYSTIVVNGETYDADKVINAEIEYVYRANDIIILTLSDGTKIYAQEGTYTLKGAK